MTTETGAAGHHDWVTALMLAAEELLDSGSSAEMWLGWAARKAAAAEAERLEARQPQRALAGVVAGLGEPAAAEGGRP